MPPSPQLPSGGAYAQTLQKHRVGGMPQQRPIAPLQRARSQGSLTGGGSRPATSASSVDAGLARLDEMCRVSSYTSHHGLLFGPQATREAHERTRALSLSAAGGAAEEIRQASEEPWRFVTTYGRMFPNHGPGARPAQTTKTDVRALLEVRMERSRQSQAEKDAEEAERKRRLAEDQQDHRIELVSYSGPRPQGEIKATFVGGLPSIYWKTEQKQSYGADVFSGSTNQRYQQPVQPVPLAKSNKERLCGAL